MLLFLVAFFFKVYKIFYKNLKSPVFKLKFNGDIIIIIAKIIKFRGFLQEITDFVFFSGNLSDGSILKKLIFIKPYF